MKKSAMVALGFAFAVGSGAFGGEAEDAYKQGWRPSSAIRTAK